MTSLCVHIFKQMVQSINYKIKNKKALVYFMKFVNHGYIF